MAEAEAPKLRESAESLKSRLRPVPGSRSLFGPAAQRARRSPVRPRAPPRLRGTPWDGNPWGLSLPGVQAKTFAFFRSRSVVPVVVNANNPLSDLDASRAVLAVLRYRPGWHALSGHFVVCLEIAFLPCCAGCSRRRSLGGAWTAETSWGCSTRQRTWSELPRHRPPGTPATTTFTMTPESMMPPGKQISM